jgi:SAM-dependent methyltransferase
METNPLPSEFTDPRLVAIFDTMNSIDWFQGFYPKLAGKLAPKSIVDIGCGTGLLTCELAKLGYKMIGLEPSGALLDLARRRPEGRGVKWIEGYVDQLDDVKADLAIMTGHVAQFFLEDEEWHKALKTIHNALNPDGHLAFESRNPLIPPFADWPTATSHKTVHDPVLGNIEWWFKLLEIKGNLVRYEIYYLFVQTGDEIVTTKKLAFRSQAEITQSLQDAGFSIENVYGDWDSSPLGPASPEMIFVAARD